MTMLSLAVILLGFSVYFTWCLVTLLLVSHFLLATSYFTWCLVSLLLVTHFLLVTSDLLSLTVLLILIYFKPACN